MRDFVNKNLTFETLDEDVTRYSAKDGIGGVVSIRSFSNNQTNYKH